jgi:hypothetical protein
MERYSSKGLRIGAVDRVHACAVAAERRDADAFWTDTLKPCLAQAVTASLTASSASTAGIRWTASVWARKFALDKPAF